MILPVYRISLWIYEILAICAMPIYPKARKWVSGRKNWRKQLSTWGGKKTIWMHCSSLGEFEQGRPLLDAIAKEYPDRDILLSFFSPSGYEIRKNYGNATKVVYLPIDSPDNAKTFIELINPKLVIFVKYDLWYYYLKTLHKKNIPTFLISASFSSHQKYFKFPFQGFYKKIFSYFTGIFTQHEDSHEYLQNKLKEITSVWKAGDTRFDRVIEQVRHPAPLKPLDIFLSEHDCIIAGSTWPADDRLLIEAINKLKDHRIKWIIAPHELNPKTFEMYKKKLRNRMILYSELNALHPGVQVLLIDNIGLLSTIYKLGDIAYIGGGISKRIHNIQEPAAYGLPLLFGPRYNDFREAIDLIEQQGAYVVDSSDQLEKRILQILPATELRHKIFQTNQHYIQLKSGATRQILNILQTGKWI
jgi:3-deoxy-D-manno-octulosonic-acid transferase